MENKLYTKAEMLAELKECWHTISEQLFDGYTWEEQAPCLEDIKDWYDTVKNSDADGFKFEQAMMSPNEFVIVELRKGEL